MDRDAGFEIFGLEWLQWKLRPEDGVSANGEADLSALKSADWEKIVGRCRTGHDWVELLTFQPRFTDRCDWTKFSGDDWRNFLCVRPEFFGKCDPEIESFSRSNLFILMK